MLIARVSWNRWRVNALFVAVVLLLRLSGGGALDLMAQEQGRPTGTAFVVHTDGYLLTAAHVVKDAVKVEVVIGRKSFDATVLGMDEKRDLALLRIKAKGLPSLPLGDSNTVQIGEEVRVFGFPLVPDLGASAKVTRGLVSAIDTKDGQRVFQIDAAINPGNSGGPLVIETGEVIGIVNAKLVGIAISNVGFAVPIDEAKPMLRSKGISFATGGAKPRWDAVIKQVSSAVGLVRVTRDGLPSVSAELVWKLTGHSDTVWSVAFSPHGKTLASAGSDGTIRVWDYVAGTLLRTLTAG